MLLNLRDQKKIKLLGPIKLDSNLESVNYILDIKNIYMYIFSQLNIQLGGSSTLYLQHGINSI